MPKTISFVLAAVVTIAAAGLWLKSSVSETTAGARPAAGQRLLVEEIVRNSNAQSMPEHRPDDRSFVFTDRE